MSDDSRGGLPDRSVDRRAFLAAGVAVGLFGVGHAAAHPAPIAAWDTALPRGDGVPAIRSRKRQLRFAHMSDIHIQPERGAPEGFSMALRHAQHSDQGAEFIVTGGDLIMDGFEATEARTKRQWELFEGVLAGECRVPIEHCIGNHDIWGWHRSNSRTRGDEPRWGKAWARERLGLAADHRTFERAGWRFIVLDSVRPDGDGYRGYLGKEQLNWLKSELAANTAIPTVIVSHIPILSVTTLARSKPTADNTIAVSGGLLHMDVHLVTALLAEHPNVKLCLSGHIHQLDSIEYRGCLYVCDGAVSGAWWKGPHRGVDEGYGLIDLFDDGSVAWRYVTYGWTARPE